MQSDDVLKFIGQVVAYGGGIAAISYLIFIWLGRKLMEDWFSKSLKNYEFRINSLLNRVTKIHEKEFEVLPEAWIRLQDALGAMTQLAQPLPSGYQDASRMSNVELNEFLETLELSQREKEELVNSTDNNRNNSLREKLFQHSLVDTQDCINKFHNYLSYNRIFLSSDLFDEFLNIDHLLYLATSKLRMEGGDSWEAAMRLSADAQGVARNIEALIQKRLHYSDAA